MKKWFLIGIPILILLALVGWRIQQKKAEEGGGASGGGAPGGAARPGGSGAASGGGAAGGARGAGGAGGGPAGGGGGGGGRGGPPAVEIALASSRRINESIEAVGTVESPLNVQISPKVSGRIDYLTAREGDAVTPGQVLVRIDPSELQSQVLQQQAGVSEARSRLAQAQLQQAPTAAGVRGQVQQQQSALRSAQAEFAQAQRTSEAQIASAQAAVTQADAGIRSAEASVRNAEAELNRDQASLINAQARLRRAETLLQQGFVSQQNVEDARNQVNVAEASVNVARGRVESARSAVESARAQRAAAVEQVEIRRRSGVADVAASRARVEQARSSVEVAQANRAQNPAFAQSIAALRSNVSSAEAQLRQARTRLGDTVLRSPIRGTVTARTADPGSLAGNGQSILTVQFLDWVYVTATVPVDRAPQVYKGQQAEVSLDAVPKRTFVGTVALVNPAADPESRQFEIRVKLQNPGKILRPGMYGRVRLITRSITAPVVVPKEAVTTGPQGKTVAVIDGESKAHIQPVTTGVADPNNVQVLSGVKAGDKVVVLTYSPLREGQEVRLPGAGGGRGAGQGRGSGAGSAGGAGAGAPAGRRGSG